MEKINITKKDSLLELIEVHEQINTTNEAIIVKQKELIATLKQHVVELKEIIEKYLLTDLPKQP